MIVWLNGQFVPEADAKVSVFDRSFLYGDGLFETVRVGNGKPFRLGAHLERLEQGAKFLGVRVPHSTTELSGLVAELIARNAINEGLLRITLSRGVGVRGYSPRGADQPTLVMSLHPFRMPIAESAATERAGWEIGAPRWRAHVASIRLPAGDVLAQFKTCNKLAQVLARAQAEAAGADEALLLNTDGFVVEAATGNLFWVCEGKVFTPPLAGGVLRGITRGVVLEICHRLDMPVQEVNVRPDELRGVDAVFLSLSSYGIVELSAIDGHALAGAPEVARIAEAHRALVRAECGERRSSATA